MKACIVLIFIVGVTLLGTDNFAANCNDPVPAPKYQVGDTFIWKYVSGDERVWEVTGFEGNLARVTWRDGLAIWANDKEGTYFFDQDWVIRKGVAKGGDVLLSPRVGPFSKLGMKELDFPLRVGKSWGFKHQSRVSWSASPTNFYWTLSVVGCEYVSTLAGKFFALKIEAVETDETYHGWGKIHWWYSPEAKSIVKVQFGNWTGTAPSSVQQVGVWSTRPVDYELVKLELK